MGILAARGDSVELRCTNCGEAYSEILPKLNKRVLYLDQNLFSILFKVQSGGRLPIGHEAFSMAAFEKLRRAVLLQQAIMPHSNLHSEETIIFANGVNLQAAYEHLGGGSRFVDTSQVEIAQVAEFAKAYRENREPAISFNADEVLQSKKDNWLPDMHIQVKADYSTFAGGIRTRRIKNHAEMTALFERWKTDKPTFHQALKNELKVFGDAKCEAYCEHFNAANAAYLQGDMKAYLSLVNEPIFDEKRAIVHALALDREEGDDLQVLQAVFDFWHWERNREVPVHRVACHLWASLAARFAGNQKTASQGTSTDIKAISTYAPYVDAMFVDREFANILQERKDIVAKLPIKARIFSFSQPDEFLSYLDDLANGASDEVRADAERIYGVK